MKLADRVSRIAGKSALTFKSLVKIALESRRTNVKAVAQPGESLVIMGNGPSLNDTIRDEREMLEKYPLMAVNFAIKSNEFFELKPEYYTMIDPVFFAEYDKNESVKYLWDTLLAWVDWPITVMVPACAVIPVDLLKNSYISIGRINPVGVEGFTWLEDWAFSSGLGMPRPRNVLIGSLMAGLLLGYKRIYIVGADHTWTENLQVNERNELCAVENHFYKEEDDVLKQRASIYRGIRMHEMMYSLYVAFSSYFAIERYAKSKGVEIINATPHSFIDAFKRGKPE